MGVNSQENLPSIKIVNQLHNYFTAVGFFNVGFEVDESDFVLTPFVEDKIITGQKDGVIDFMFIVFENTTDGNLTVTIKGVKIMDYYLEINPWYLNPKIALDVNKPSILNLKILSIVQFKTTKYDRITYEFEIETPDGKSTKLEYSNSTDPNYTFILQVPYVYCIKPLINLKGYFNGNVVKNFSAELNYFEPFFYFYNSVPLMEGGLVTLKGSNFFSPKDQTQILIKNRICRIYKEEIPYYKCVFDGDVLAPGVGNKGLDIELRGYDKFNNLVITSKESEFLYTQTKACSPLTKNKCSYRGYCDKSIGMCKCNEGFGGHDCSIQTLSLGLSVSNFTTDNYPNDIFNSCGEEVKLKVVNDTAKYPTQHWCQIETPLSIVSLKIIDTMLINLKKWKSSNNKVYLPEKNNFELETDTDNESLFSFFVNEQGIISHQAAVIVSITPKLEFLKYSFRHCKWCQRFVGPSACGVGEKICYTLEFGICSGQMSVSCGRPEFKFGYQNIIIRQIDSPGLLVFSTFDSANCLVEHHDIISIPNCTNVNGIGTDFLEIP
eukprot:gene4061-5084_t